MRSSRFVCRGYAVVALAALMAACGSPSSEPTRPQPAVLPEPPRLTEQLPTDFEGWFTFGNVVVEDAATSSPARQQDADRLTFNDDALIFLARPGAVAAGDTLTFRVWLWADDARQAVIYVNEGCGPPDGDVSYTFVDLTPTPREFSHTHSFARDQECAQMQIKGWAPPMSLYAYGPRIRQE
jgi:hypothetical protein